MLPLAKPAVVGSKVALMVHEELAANDAPQVLVSAKEAVAEIVSACPTVSLFLTVNTAVALPVPSPTEPKL